MPSICLGSACILQADRALKRGLCTRLLGSCMASCYEHKQVTNDEFL